MAKRIPSCMATHTNTCDRPIHDFSFPRWEEICRKEVYEMGDVFDSTNFERFDVSATVYQAKVAYIPYIVYMSILGKLTTQDETPSGAALT
jgi:hypothetical protein